MNSNSIEIRVVDRLNKKSKSLTVYSNDKKVLTVEEVFNELAKLIHGQTTFKDTKSYRFY